eukprot:gene1815-2482_t
MESKALLVVLVVVSSIGALTADAQTSHSATRNYLRKLSQEVQTDAVLTTFVEHRSMYGFYPATSVGGALLFSRLLSSQRAVRVALLPSRRAVRVALFPSRRAGCGVGCMYASELVDFSSQYINQGTQTSLQLLGPPDFYPNIGSSGAVYVTKLEVYETFHPGAVVKIMGRSTSRTQWYTLWEGNTSVPEGSSVPKISAPRNRPLDEFRLFLDTAGVDGFNEIDAVKAGTADDQRWCAPGQPELLTGQPRDLEVYGDDENGNPIDNYGPYCPEGDLTTADCWYLCAAADVFDIERSQDTLDITARAVAWISEALKVKSVGDRLYLFAEEGTDPSSPMCNDVEFPDDTMGLNGAAAQVVLFVTGRPVQLDEDGPTDRSLPSASACRFAEDGRPTAIHMNVPPQYASAGKAAGAEGLEHVVDGVIHHLFRALGWGPEYHRSFLSSPGVDVVECPNAPEDLLIIQTPKITEKVTEHFGSTITYVELENGGDVGERGVLLEDRIFHGELMTVPQQGVKMVKSEISLALLEDTGWYFPQYEIAQTLPWGYLQGLEFATFPCNKWPESAAHYVCPTKEFSLEGRLFDSSQLVAPSCSANRTSKAQCNFVEHNRPLDGPYQYFKQPEESHLGGPDALSDYCPWTQPLPDFSGDCTDPTNAVAGAYYEEYGPASRCFEGYRRTEDNPLLGCVKHHCFEQRLYLKMGTYPDSDYQECEKGGLAAFTAQSVVIYCPDPQPMCTTYKEMVPPSIVVYEPKDNAIISPYQNAVFELSNFVIPEDGHLLVTVEGIEHQVYNTKQQVHTFEKEFELHMLPEGRVHMGFHLVTKRGEVVYSSNITLSVILEKKLWVNQVLKVSSEYASRQALQLVGENATHRYRSSEFSWSPETGGTGSEFVEIQVDTAVYLTGLVLYENFSPGRLRQVYSLANASNGGTTRHLVWAGEVHPSSKPLLDAQYQPVEIALRDTIATRDISSAERRLPDAPARAVGQVRGAGWPPLVVVDSLRLEFVTPSWFEIDAIKVLGRLETPPLLEPRNGGIYAFTFRPGETRHVQLHLDSMGTSTLYWAVRNPEDLPVWVTPNNATGVVFGQDVLSLDFTVVVRDMVGSATAVASVELHNIHALATESLITVQLVIQMDFSPDLEPMVPVCYNGVVLGATETYGGECVCHDGAYGNSCEYLYCPNNCSTSVEEKVVRGMCAPGTGLCSCAFGFYGLDCSGQEGDCYVSYDGSCKHGFDAGSFLMNTEDQDSKPCERPDCLPEYSTGECRSVVQEYCFAHPEDSACNSFTPHPAPASYCPDGLALDYCAANPEDEACATVYADRSGCLFMEAETSPCNFPECAAGDVLSDACSPFVKTHCEAHPEDTECDLYSYGDRCLFLPGAASDVCLTAQCGVFTDSYDKEVCDGITDFYCQSIRASGEEDPECIFNGFSDEVSTFVQPQHTACPWDAIYKECALDAASPGCIQLHINGLLKRDASEQLPTSSALEPEISEDYDEAYVKFTAVGTAKEEVHRDDTGAIVLAHYMWGAANTDDVDGLSDVEFGTCVQYMSSILRLNNIYSLSPPVEEFETALYAAAANGGFLTYEEFEQVIADYIVVSYSERGL